MNRELRGSPDTGHGSNQHGVTMAWAAIIAQAELVIRYISDITALYRIAEDLKRLLAWVEQKIADQEHKGDKK